ncbi:MAG TPA: hypothetical protein VE263_08835, partial [Candidatus Angelobacter sp.]|nr:hypothetical protein [Candidatus Angelobacter sp.]
GLDWFPTLMAAAGNPDIKDQLMKGVTVRNQKYKNHLDGYNQMEMLLCKGPSARCPASAGNGESVLPLR